MNLKKDYICKSKLSTDRLSRKVERSNERLTAGFGKRPHLNLESSSITRRGKNTFHLWNRRNFLRRIYHTYIAFPTPAPFLNGRHESKISKRGFRKRNTCPHVHLGNQVIFCIYVIPCLPLKLTKSSLFFPIPFHSPFNLHIISFLGPWGPLVLPLVNLPACPNTRMR